MGSDGADTARPGMRTSATQGGKDVANPDQITFRPLSLDDLPMMHRCLNHGPALTWYGQKPTTLDEVRSEYAPMLEGREPVLPFIVACGGRPIGHIQTYRTDDWPDYWGRAEMPPGTAGIDLFIGEESHLHRGFGARILLRFLAEVVFADPTAARCVIDPDPANFSAIRAYGKAGFTYVRTLLPPEHEDPAYLMILDRSTFEAG